jgi:hypothetical protein
MREITAKNAKYLRPGTKLLMLNFKGCRPKSEHEKVLLTYVVSKKVAKKRWGKQCRSYDVWYWYPSGSECFTIIDADTGDLMWEHICAFKDSELEKIKVLNAL